MYMYVSMNVFVYACLTYPTLNTDTVEYLSKGIPDGRTRRVRRQGI